MVSAQVYFLDKIPQPVRSSRIRSHHTRFRSTVTGVMQYALLLSAQLVLSYIIPPNRAVEFAGTWPLPVNSCCNFLPDKRNYNTTFYSFLKAYRCDTASPELMLCTASAITPAQETCTHTHKREPPCLLGHGRE